MATNRKPKKKAKRKEPTLVELLERIEVLEEKVTDLEHDLADVRMEMPDA